MTDASKSQAPSSRASRSDLAAALDRAQRAEAAVAEMQASTSFRLARRMADISRRIAPLNTRRRALLAKGKQGAAAAYRAVKKAVPRGRIVLRTSTEPVVSIVVPVHGKWAYTEACLRSLAAVTTDLPFEVVVVDDRSPDRTLAHLRKVEGVRVIALAKNQGYVGATNAGIAAARGTHLLLLNNDTRVAHDFIDPLMERLADPGVGLVGAKLIYPNGMLQDAGGIVFADGSAWNYGKFKNALSHEHVYARDVDYVSGACTLIRRETLDQLGGGLDPRYSPAYYDDTDLAFAVRSLGLRVIYEPRSVVIHDEGISHGTDENSGVKRYQVINHEKFVEKWGETLAAECPPRDEAIVEWAARRRNGKRVVVLVDSIVPKPDVDSGSVRRFAFIKELREQGYHVLFAPESAERPEPYTHALLSLGVEVLDVGCDLAGELESLRGHLEAIVLSRGPVAATYAFSLTKAFPEVPLIFDTVDLHYLREERESELLNGTIGAAHARYMRDLEHAIASVSDVTVVVSAVERQILARDMPDVPVALVSNVHAMPPSPAPVEGRHGMLFVGSFLHQPNVDAMLGYLQDIHPHVVKELGSYPLTIVGRDAPPELVNAVEGLGDPSVHLAGWVEDLAPLYQSARLAIAPLRFGAGVKGKIGEALSWGVPTVMTSVGAEGMRIVDGETALVADDPERFAGSIVRLVRDDELWSDLSTRGREHIDTHFGPSRFRADIKSMLALARTHHGGS